MGLYFCIDNISVQLNLLLRFFHQVQLRLEGFVVEVWTVDQQIVGHILYEGSLVGGHIFRSHVQEAYQRVACQDMPPGTPSGWYQLGRRGNYEAPHRNHVSPGRHVCRVRTRVILSWATNYINATMPLGIDRASFNQPQFRISWCWTRAWLCDGHVITRLSGALLWWCDTQADYLTCILTRDETVSISLSCLS